MTQEQKIIKNKLGLLKLAQTLGSVRRRHPIDAEPAAEFRHVPM